MAAFSGASRTSEEVPTSDRDIADCHCKWSPKLGSPVRTCSQARHAKIADEKPRLAAPHALPSDTSAQSKEAVLGT